ncbi:MAG: hypothetical protein IH987_13295 [Planctomycetes bacterium]|nr:hypothetical protein [Planctomycetota bacterium]
MQKADQGAVALRAIMRKQIEQAYIDRVACGITDFVICVVQEDSGTIWIGTPNQAEFVNLMKRLGRPEAARVVTERASPATYWLFVVSLSGAELSRPVF